MTFKIEITAEGITSGGKPLPVGTKIEHPEAWRHCLTGFHSSTAIAKPVDKATRNKVAEELQKKQTKAENVKAQLQVRMNELATKLTVNDDGKFKRTAGGNISKASSTETVEIDNAEAYGIYPQVD